MTRGRGRPRLGIDGAIRDGELRLLVEREIATGLSIALAQRRVARKGKLTVRQVRTAWERIGPVKRSDNSVILTPKNGGLGYADASGQWREVVSREELAEADADLARALGNPQGAQKV